MLKLLNNSWEGYTIYSNSLQFLPIHQSCISTDYGKQSRYIEYS